MIRIARVSIVVATLATSVAACGGAEPRSANDARPQPESAPGKPEKREGGLALKAELKDSLVLASVERHSECREYRSSPWHECDVKPAEKVMVALWAGSHPAMGEKPDLVSLSDANGRTTFDLSSLNAGRMLRAPFVQLFIDGDAHKEHAEIDLSSSALYAKWEETVAAGNKKREAQFAAERAERDSEPQQEAAPAAGSATRTTVHGVLLDPAAHKGKVVVFRNVIVSGVDITSQTAAAYVHDASDGVSALKSVAIRLASDTPRNVRAALLNLPGPDAIVVEVRGLVSAYPNGAPFIFPLSIGEAARY